MEGGQDRGELTAAIPLQQQQLAHRGYLPEKGMDGWREEESEGEDEGRREGESDRQL